MRWRYARLISVLATLAHAVHEKGHHVAVGLIPQVIVGVRHTVALGGIEGIASGRTSYTSTAGDPELPPYVSAVDTKCHIADMFTKTIIKSDTWEMLTELAQIRSHESLANQKEQIIDGVFTMMMGQEYNSNIEKMLHIL